MLPLGHFPTGVSVRRAAFDHAHVVPYNLVAEGAVFTICAALIRLGFRVTSAWYGAFCNWDFAQFRCRGQIVVAVICVVAAAAMTVVSFALVWRSHVAPCSLAFFPSLMSHSLPPIL